ncbi:MAG: hypothetical protein UY16_C0042G0010 [Candidatus Gottesmanbacteria bacterium GW2011_GWA2_47_9]|uniref:Uncharacterized protein n=1 Tax=Candidatus Gottesmanbacteria bacterium GW2011_GWA2_47_9 TaxID=1618445 RepID=A0A0G1TYT6_9BACT|nr:MAG: hypothetical protein UY16_C0042G0010 [Candidatus Gottesmanbacteria bacterium GW2011_GWA2_47_9]
MHQHNPDEPRVDATVAYTGELDLNFTAQYPLLQTEQDIGMLLDGQTPFVSLKIPRTPTTDPFFKKALATILEVAGTEGHPAYSAHAFGGHTTAPEVIDTICQYIAAGDFTVEPQRHYKKVRVLTPTGAEAQETVLVERYIVKTPPYERTTGVPVPRLEQQRIFSFLTLRILKRNSKTAAKHRLPATDPAIGNYFGKLPSFSRCTRPLP